MAIVGTGILNNYQIPNTQLYHAVPETFSVELGASNLECELLQLKHHHPRMTS